MPMPACPKNVLSLFQVVDPKYASELSIKFKNIHSRYLTPLPRKKVNFKLVAYKAVSYTNKISESRLLTVVVVVGCVWGDSELKLSRRKSMKRDE